jgi:protein ImuB
MAQRFATIWFRYLRTDWFCRRQAHLKQVPFVLALPDHGRMVVTSSNPLAQAEGVFPGMVVADARAIIPSLQVFDDNPALSEKLLTAIAEWSIRFSPVVAIDLPDGIILDITGCPHLWGGEKEYLTDIINRFNEFGYHTHGAIADTIGAAWAIAHFTQEPTIVPRQQQANALMKLPPHALRIGDEITDRLVKVGLRQIKDFIAMPAPVLRRRFGPVFIQRLYQALGYEQEIIVPVTPVEPYQERLPCLEPVVTAAGIEIALKKLLETGCARLQKEQKGLRKAIFKCYRVDGRMECIEIGTHRPSHNALHLYKLFELKIENIEPALGIELFTLDAQKVEDAIPAQEKLWEGTCGLNNVGLAELIDRLEVKIGPGRIHRFVADEHYWPERSLKPAAGLTIQPESTWKLERPRPVQLLKNPEQVEVAAPIPDYPPMLFRRRGKVHKIVKADGPERIEQEWWLQDGLHRDYYMVEDEAGRRYWLFRLGHYDEERSYKWFIHGFFA